MMMMYSGVNLCKMAYLLVVAIFSTTFLVNGQQFRLEADKSYLTPNDNSITLKCTGPVQEQSVVIISTDGYYITYNSSRSDRMRDNITVINKQTIRLNDLNFGLSDALCMVDGMWSTRINVPFVSELNYSHSKQNEQRNEKSFTATCHFKTNPFLEAVKVSFLLDNITIAEYNQKKIGLYPATTNFSIPEWVEGVTVEQPNDSRYDNNFAIKVAVNNTVKGKYQCALAFPTAQGSATVYSNLVDTNNSLIVLPSVFLLAMCLISIFTLDLLK